MIKKLLTAAALMATAAAPLLPLASATPAAAVSCTVTVRLTPGITHGAVACLEQRLIELRYRTGTADTVYDAASVNAVKLFQRHRGLYPDGIVTSITGRQLGLRGALPPAGSPKVTVLGDSTSAAMRWYDEARNESAIYDIMGTSYDLQWSVESCRRLVAPSCVGRTDPGTGGRWVPISVLPEMRGNLRGRLGDAVVIMAGYDDYPSITVAIDSIVAEAEAQGVARVFWLTYRTTSSYGYGGYYTQHNAALAAAKVRHPNLVVLDWNGYTHRQTAATQGAWFEADGIHMTRSGGVALAQFLKGAVDASAVRSCTTARATNGTIAAPIGAAPTPNATPTGFQPMLNTRVFDSRPTKMGAGREVSLDLAARGVPAQALSASLSITVVDPCASGTLTAYACGTRPPVATIGFEGGRVTSGAAIVPLNAGRVCVYTSAATDLVVDVNGWFEPTGDPLHGITPVRVLDRRTGSALAAGSQTTVDLAGRVPASATAVWLNVALISTGADGGVLVYPGACGAVPPGATANTFAGRGVWTTALVGVTAQKVCVRAAAKSPIRVVVDVWGYFDPEPTGGMLYRALPAITLFSSAITANTQAGIAAQNVPVLNVTTGDGSGGLTVRRCGPVNGPALLQEVPGELVSNLDVVGTSSGKFCALSSTATRLNVVRTGEFVPTPA